MAGVTARRYRRPAPIDARHDTSGFACGHDVLDDWLKTRALKAEGRSARTYVVCEQRAVVGYYSLATGSIARGVLTKRPQRNAPDPVPVMIVSRLAVDERCRGEGIGRGMLRDAHAARAAGRRPRRLPGRACPRHRRRGGHLLCRLRLCRDSRRRPAHGPAGRRRCAARSDGVSASRRGSPPAGPPGITAQTYPPRQNLSYNRCRPARRGSCPVPTGSRGVERRLLRPGYRTRLDREASASSRRHYDRLWDMTHLKGGRRR